MGALGAEVILVDRLEHSRHGHISGDDLALVEAAARRVTDERSALRADQFRLPGGANAHESGTGQRRGAVRGTIEVFCEFVGTGGTFAGVARYLKSQNPGVVCYMVEPEGAAAMAGKETTNPRHRIQGGG